jgi:hypothetical protein
MVDALRSRENLSSCYGPGTIEILQLRGCSLKRLVYPIIVAAAGVAGCTSVPDTPDIAIILQSDYKTLADCVEPEFTRMGGWKRNDDDAAGKVEFFTDNQASTGGRVDLSAKGENATEVVTNLAAPDWGKSYWPENIRPILERCAADPSPIVPLSKDPG